MDIESESNKDKLIFNDEKNHANENDKDKDNDHQYKNENKLKNVQNELSVSTDESKDQLINEYIDILDKIVYKDNKYQYRILLLGFSIFTLVYIILGGIVLLDDFPSVIYSEGGIINQKKVDKDFCKRINKKEVTIIEVLKDSNYSWAVEFDFYCSEISNAFLNASLFSGIIFAMIFLPIFNNFLGRWKTILITLVCSFSISFMVLFAFNKEMLFIGVFLFNFFAIISAHTSIMYTIEIADNSKRSLFITIVQLGSTLSMLVYNTSSYYSNSWRTSFYIYYSMFVCIVSYTFFFIKESPKTYISKKDYLEFMLSLLRISKLNRTDKIFLKFLALNSEAIFINDETKLLNDEENNLFKSFGKFSKVLDIDADSELDYNKENSFSEKQHHSISKYKVCFKSLRKYFNYESRKFAKEASYKTNKNDKDSVVKKLNFDNFTDTKTDIEFNSNLKDESINEKFTSKNEKYLPCLLIKYKSQRNKFLLLEIIVFLGCGVYFGHTVNIKNLPGNIFTNALINIGVELVGNIISNYAMNSKLFGRVNSLKYYYLFSFLLYLVLTIFSLSNTVNNIISFSIKISLVGPINIFFVLCSESYPNTIRNYGYGFNIGTGKIGSLIFSFVGELISTFQSNLIFSASCFVIFICTFFIEETLGKNLETEIPELLELLNKDQFET